MAGDLYPTPSRLALLADIAAGQDTRDPLVHWEANHWWHGDGGRLDHRMAELLDFAVPPWAVTGPHPVLDGRRVARLTTAGRAALERGRAT